MDGAPSTVYTGKGVAQEIESKEGKGEYLGGAMGVFFPSVVGQYLPLIIFLRGEQDEYSRLSSVQLHKCHF